MKSVFWKVVLVLFLTSCQGNKEEKHPSDQKSESPAEPEKKESRTEKFTSPKWKFALEKPSSYQVYQGTLPGDHPVINLFEPAENHQPPFAIHDQADISYVAFLPEGFGVDAPSGERKTLREWKGSLPLSFGVDPDRSWVYLLEDGQVRSVMVRFQMPPPNWTTQGLIYVHYAISNFKGQCFSESSGEEIPMEACDPMGGDRVSFSGKVDPQSQKELNAILEQTYFFSEADPGSGISNLIRLDQPVPNQEINSPLQIRGRARGSWFFEAEAPVQVLSENGKLLGSGSIKAKGKWMTSEFVPFEGELRFDTAETTEGFLVFKHSNASGKPEHDRSWRIPVQFSSSQ